MDRIQVLDFLDTYDDQTNNEMVIFGRDENSEAKIIRVVGCPITICVAVGEEFTGAAELADGLNKFLLKNKPQCRKLGCSCGGDQYGIFREPCVRERQYIGYAVSKFEYVRGYGYEVYEEHTRPFVKFTLNRSFFVQNAVKFLESAYVGSISDMHRGVYDRVVSGVDQFILNKCVSSFNWVEFPKGQTEVEYEDLVVLAKNDKQANFTVFTFDIEVISKVYKNNETRKALYPVGLISTTVLVQDANNNTISEVNRTFMLNAPGCVDLPDPEIAFFDDERDLLMAFHDHVKASNPDFWAGYNSNKYDMPYLLRRADLLDLPKFKYMSRLKNEPIVFRESEDPDAPVVSEDHVDTSKHVEKKAKLSAPIKKGEKKAKKVKKAKHNTKTTIDCPGGVFLDLFPVIKKAYKFQSYKLKDVAVELKLSKGKDDLEYTEIDAHFHGTPEMRARLAKYCKKDVLVTVLIAKKTDVVRKLIAQCLLLRVRARDALDRGDGYVLGMMLRSELKGEYYVNKRAKDIMMRALEAIEGYSILHGNMMNGKSYEGGFVKDPITGLYRCAIITLDFNSLYPNIMRTFNICFSTQTLNTRRSDIHTSPEGFGFVKQHVRLGVIPRILERLINSRNDVKLRMETVTDKAVLAMMNIEQNQLKITTNALYGITGARTSEWISLSLASSVTSWGRFYIQMCCDALNEEPFFEEKYGFKRPESEFKEKYGLEIVYGDTDSLFIALHKVTTTDKVETDRIGNEIRTWVNVTSKLMVGTLKMGFENCANPFLLIKKKKYAKVIVEDNGKKKLKLSGLDTRSITEYCRNLLKTILNMGMLEDKSSEEIEAVIFEAFDALWSGYGYGIQNLNDMVHTTNLSGSLDEYTVDYVQVVAGKQMRAAGMTVEVDDRVQYYYCNVARNKDKKKSDLVVAAALMGNHTLHIQTYVDEIVGTLSATILGFLTGRNEEEQLETLERLATPRRKPEPVLRRAPTRIMGGVIDAFVARGAKKARIDDDVVKDEESEDEEEVVQDEVDAKDGDRRKVNVALPSDLRALTRKKQRQCSMSEFF